MMKKLIILQITILMAVCHMSSQTNYRDLLVQEHRSFWAIPYTVCYSGKFDIYFSKQVGIYFDTTGLFDWYLITDDNDTIPERYNLDTEWHYSHRTYELSNDTIFITAWYNKQDKNGNTPTVTDVAYKILYLTDKRLVLLQLERDGFGGWNDEYSIDTCTFLNITNYIHMTR